VVQCGQFAVEQQVEFVVKGLAQRIDGGGIGYTVEQRFAGRLALSSRVARSIERGRRFAKRSNSATSSRGRPTAAAMRSTLTGRSSAALRLRSTSSGAAPSAPG